MNLYRILTLLAVGIVVLIAFTLGTGVILYIAFQHQTEDEITAYEAAIRERGEPVTLDELIAYYPEVPEDQNAALVYLRACDAMEAWDPDGARAEDLYKQLRESEQGAALSQELRAEIAKYAAEFAVVWPTLREAAALKLARYPVDARQGFGMELPHLTRLRNLARAIAIASVHSAIEDDTASFADGQRQLALLMESLDSEPVHISQLVRIGILEVAVNGLAHGYFECLREDSAKLGARNPDSA